MQCANVAMRGQAYSWVQYSHASIQATRRSTATSHDSIHCNFVASYTAMHAVGLTKTYQMYIKCTIAYVARSTVTEIIVMFGLTPKRALLCNVTHAQSRRNLYIESATDHKARLRDWHVKLKVIPIKHAVSIASMFNEYSWKNRRNHNKP
jgi:phage terminase large subunit